MKVVTENLALASLFAITFGLIKMHLYYTYFNIEIVTYLDISEVFQIQFFYFLILGLILSFVGFVIFDYYNINKFSFDKDANGFVSGDKKRVVEPYIIFVYFFAAIGAVYVAGIQMSSSSATDLKEGESISEVTMITEKETVVTDKTLVFVGRTKNYIFFFDKNKKQSRIFKNDNVKEIRFMKGVDYSVLKDL